MRPLSTFYCAFLLILIIAAAVDAETFEPETGATIVWAGDSITHQCGYTQYVENFLYTRFHDKKLRFMNAGIRGDDAGDLRDRFDEDVAVWKPQYVTVLLGMNDGRYKSFQRKNFEVYQRVMKEVLDRLRGIGARSIILSPTMFDHQQYAIRDAEKDFRFKRLAPHAEYNAKLAFYGGWLREVARVRNLEFIDVWGPMNEFTKLTRREESDFTILPDSIHPNPDGMALIAVEMAKFFAGDRQDANRVELRLLKSGEVTVAGEIEVKRFDRNGLEATILPQSLPWVIPATGEIGPAPWYYVDDPSEGFRAALKNTSLNNHTLMVTGLEEGVYEIVMNGEVGLIVESDSLVRGIQLQHLADYPSFRQSQRLAALNARRNEEAIRPYRDLQTKMKSARRKYMKNASRVSAAREAIEPDLEALYALAAELEDEIHGIAVPQPYRLEVRRFTK